MFLNLFIDFHQSFILHFQSQTEVAGNAFAELDQRLVGDLEMFCHNFLLPGGRSKNILLPVKLLLLGQSFVISQSRFDAINPK